MMFAPTESMQGYSTRIGRADSRIPAENECFYRNEIGVKPFIALLNQCC